jgi:hypothetical protein
MMYMCDHVATHAVKIHGRARWVTREFAALHPHNHIVLYNLYNDPDAGASGWDIDR